MPKAYFVLMIYNEEDSIESVVESIVGCELPAHYERQIVAINDGSTDKSLEILERLKESAPIHIIHFDERQGIPISFRGAFKYLGPILNDQDIVFTLEADGTNDIRCVPMMVDAIETGADIVIASRYAPGAASLGFPWYRLWGSRAVNIFLQILWRVPHAKDYSVLYRVYRSSMLKTYIADDIPFIARKSFAVIAEILLHMSRYKPKIVEVPLIYDYRLKKGKSKMNLVKTLAEYVRITVVTTFS